MISDNDLGNGAFSGIVLYLGVQNKQFLFPPHFPPTLPVLNFKMQKGPIPEWHRFQLLYLILIHNGLESVFQVIISPSKFPITSKCKLHYLLSFPMRT